MTDSNERDQYVLGTDEVELARLGVQHRLWSASAHELWERAAVQPGWRVLDLGCGPGYAAFDLAQLVGPTGGVLGIEESAGFAEACRTGAQARQLGNVEVMHGDVHDLASLIGQRAGSFHLAWARWVLCFLEDPASVVDQVADVLPLGGRVAFQDYFNYRAMTLAPQRDPFDRVISKVDQSWRDHGGDPDVMGRIPEMLRRRGFRVLHFDVRQRLAHPGEQMWHWPDIFWKSFLPRLVATGYVTDQERADFELAWAEASADPDTFMVLPAMYEIVAEKR